MPPNQATSDGSNLVQQQKTKTKRRWWLFRKAGPQDAAKTAEEEKDVYKFRCCNSLFIIPHFHHVDGFSALATSGLTLILLLIFFFAVFPQFKDAQRELVRGASELLARNAEDQWALCPDVWKSYNNVSGVVQFSSTTFPNITCTATGSGPDQEVLGALPEAALALLGFMSFFHKVPGVGEDASYWCYGQEEMINFFTRTQTAPSIRALVTEPDGGCLSTSRNHTCITKAVNMIPDWDQECTGLSRWGWTSRGAKNRAKVLLDWIKDWNLKDVLSFMYSSPGDHLPHMLLVVRLQNSNDQQRYDYVVPLAGSGYESDPALTKFNQVLHVLRSVSNVSEWAYVYDAFLQTCQNSSGGVAMRQCLLRQNASVELVDASNARKAEFQCALNVDKSMWGAWQTAYSVYQQGLFKQEWPLVRMSLDYDVFFAYWAGLVGAFLSAIFAALAFFAYFLVAVCHEGRELVKKHRALEREAAVDGIGMEQQTHHESAGLLQAEAGLAGSPTGVAIANFKAASLSA